LEDVARSAALFPLVGALLAAVLFGIGFLASLVFSAAVCRVLVIVGWVALTGGLHLDGLADAADGILGGRTPERRLEIMRDSRIGTFGLLAVLSVLGLKTAFLFELPPQSTAPAILVAAVTARAGQVALIRVFPSARPDGLGSFFKTHLRTRDFSIAVGFAVAVAFVAGGAVSVAICAGAGCFVLLSGALVRRSLGGLTGDIYGAVCECCEVLVLVAWAAVSSRVNGAVLQPLWSPVISVPVW
jgi:adenosylcobinamide-GDP ribazoletransferase